MDATKRIISPAVRSIKKLAIDERSGDFNPSHLHLIQFEFRHDLWHQKTGAIVWHYVRDQTFSHFDTILQYDN